jgi:hypothetical protein
MYSWPMRSMFSTVAEGESCKQDTHTESTCESLKSDAQARMQKSGMQNLHPFMYSITLNSTANLLQALHRKLLEDSKDATYHKPCACS